MPAYNVEMNRTASTSLSVGGVFADNSAPRRAKIFRILFGSEGTPADAAFLLQAQRSTTQGTSTAVTPQALDPGDPVAINDAGENHTVDPTLTSNAILLSVPVHQRSTFHFYAVPGRELVIPGTANNGIALRTPTAPTVAVTASVHFEE